MENNNAQKILNEIYIALLGEDYYISEPLSANRANEIIRDEIIARYSKRACNKNKHMTPDIYRSKHRKCKYCKYRHGYRCIAKNIDIFSHVESCKSMWFCKCYTPIPFFKENK